MGRGMVKRYFSWALDMILAKVILKKQQLSLLFSGRG
jgi:hypothetical protein